jgi:ABC-type phosphate/phosphonate transport system permease subunit
MNIRMAAILGFVGAGGLGQLLYFELSLFHHAQASTVIIAMLILSIAVDQASAEWHLLKLFWVPLAAHIISREMALFHQ